MHESDHASIWQDDVVPPRHPKFWGDREVDVVVVGGGITGVVATALCKRAGLRVVLLEARRLGAGVTGGTTAHLTAVTDARFSELLHAFGKDKALQVWRDNMEAIDLIESLAAEHGIDCDFMRVPGALYAAKKGHARWIEKQSEAAREIGVPHELVDTLPLPYDVHKALKVERQARFHPLKFVYGLASTLPGLGCEVFENSRVLHIDPGDPCTVTTEDGRIRARVVILATHSPIGLVITAHTRLEAFRSYAIAAKVPGTVPDGLYWDSLDPYNYVRKHGDLVIVGGRDHKTGQGSDGREWDDLEKLTAEKFGGCEVVHRWSAQVYEPHDGLPFIGPMPAGKGVYYATGYAGNGMTWGVAAAKLLTAMAAGEAAPGAELYAPSRVGPASGMPKMLKENVETAFHFIADRLSGGDVRSIDAVPAGEGRLVRIDGRMHAVYREPTGATHVMSAVCTHAGCIVQWNDAEKSWDCPCHGGRFTCTGQVLDGPPVRALHSAHRMAPVYGPPKAPEAKDEPTPPEPRDESPPAK